MKAYVRWPLLIVLVVFSLLLLFHFSLGINEKPVPQNQINEAWRLTALVNKASIGSPVRLMIPAINVNAGIQHVGVALGGEMEVPSNTVDVGWFKLGSLPGEKGSAVISGHLDGKNGKEGVFANLHKLKKGDKLYIEDNSGIPTTFVVQGSRTYDPGYAEEVFNRNDNAHLNLITCDGVWDGVKKIYSERLVVFADISMPGSH